VTPVAGFVAAATGKSNRGEVGRRPLRASTCSSSSSSGSSSRRRASATSTGSTECWASMLSRFSRVVVKIMAMASDNVGTSPDWRFPPAPHRSMSPDASPTDCASSAQIRTRLGA